MQCPETGREGPAPPDPSRGKSVGVHGAETIQPLLNAGLLDEIHVDLAAVLLGEGLRLFDHLANTPVVVGNPTVVTGVGVTHLRYPVHTSWTIGGSGHS